MLNFMLKSRGQQLIYLFLIILICLSSRWRVIIYCFRGQRLLIYVVTYSKQVARYHMKLLIKNVYVGNVFCYMHSLICVNISYTSILLRVW